jgi:hypothetical protein
MDPGFRVLAMPGELQARGTSCNCICTDAAKRLLQQHLIIEAVRMENRDVEIV